MKKRAIVLLVVLIAMAVIYTMNQRENGSKSKSDSPTLVVGIVVDQMRYDYLYRYWDSYSDNGFKRLLKDGFSCENHHFSYAPTKTGPGHASIFSGTTPAVHGIIANDWWQKKEKEFIYCAEDQSVNPVGSTSKYERRSPRNIMVTNLSDEIKLSFSYRSKVIGISIKDRGAIFPAGKLADAAYWFTGSDGGKFISSDYYMDELPAWVTDFNASSTVEDYLKEGWTPLYEDDSYWQSNADESPYEGDEWGKLEPVFPYDLWAISEKEGNANIIKSTPHGNSILNDFAFLAIENEGLGEDEFIDVLTISYSSPDYIGHNFGTRAKETQDTYLRLDLSIAALLDELDEKVGDGNYLVFLTADHGAAIVPQELIDNNVNIEYFSKRDFDTYIKSVLNSKFDNKYLVKSNVNGIIALDDSVIVTNKLNKTEIEEFIANKRKHFAGLISEMKDQDGFFFKEDFIHFIDSISVAKYGNKELIESISNEQLFLDLDLLEEMDLERDDVEEFYADEILKFPGVYISASATSMTEGSFTDHRLMLQKGYNQKLSGNILYIINPGWLSYAKTGTQHGSPFNYDTHVPFILYGHGINSGQTHRRTWVEDIAPTITSLLHVQAPMASTGNPVFEVLDR